MFVCVCVCVCVCARACVCVSYPCMYVCVLFCLLGDLVCRFPVFSSFLESSGNSMWLCACVFIEYDVISIFQSLFVSDSSTEQQIII